MFGPHYFRSWMEICRNFQEEVTVHGLKLPPIHFWAPTRMWAVGSYEASTVCLGDEDLKCVPSNLAFRPSALHFGEAPPMLPGKGYAAGSMAGTPDEGIRLADWPCPAYLPPEKKGGQVFDPETQRWGGGTCSRAWGPNTTDGKEVKPMQDGGTGCRVCWTRPELSVAYAEH